MRAWFIRVSPRGGAAAWLGIAAAACSVPAKQAGEPDAGTGPGADAPPDTTAPDTTIDRAPGEFSSDRQATFRFSSDDPTATFLCRIDDGDQRPCSSPLVQALPDGAHSFSVRAIDAAGNTDDSPAEQLFTIDTVAPDTTLDTKPPAADNSVLAIFKFSSPDPSAAFACALDGGAYAPCKTGDAFGPIGDGSHAFSVRAFDRAGNADATPAGWVWSVDTSTPDTQIRTAPEAITAQTTARFTFDSPDAGAGDSFQCALDTPAFTPCTSPAGYAGLREGVHQFAVRVRDINGNIDPSPAELTWRVDLTPPTTTIVDGPSGAEPVASTSISFTSSEPASTFACSLDGAAFTACTSPAPLTGLAQGRHGFTVRATDAAGHTDSSPPSVTWTVDTVSPVVTLSGGPADATTVGPRIVIGFRATEGSVACSLDDAAFAACTSPLAVNLPAGGHQFSVRATDAAGNADVATRSWTIACGGPDPAVEAGVLHFDGYGQTLDNAVAGGAPATLGDTADPGPGEPAALAAGRFDGGLQFTSAQGDHVAWPIGLAAMPALTLEAWARPAAVTGARDLATSSDGSVALRVTAASPTTVVFSISVFDGGAGPSPTVSSAPVAAGVWHYVLASLAPPSLLLWVDGTRSAPAELQLMAAPAHDALRLGGAGPGAYDGALDEVAVGQGAITEDEPALARYCPLR